VSILLLTKLIFILRIVVSVRGKKQLERVQTGSYYYCVTKCYIHRKPYFTYYLPILECFLFSTYCHIYNLTAGIIDCSFLSSILAQSIALHIIYWIKWYIINKNVHQIEQEKLSYLNTLFKIGNIRQLTYFVIFMYFLLLLLHSTFNLALRTFSILLLWNVYIIQTNCLI